MTRFISSTPRRRAGIAFGLRSEILVPVSEFAFIDPGVSALRFLLAGLRPGVRAVVLDAATPAASQMARALAGHQALAAIHVFAHGVPGRVDFTAGPLSADNLDEHTAALAAIGRALHSDGSVQLWSCRTGLGAAGARFVAGLQVALGAPVAAARGVIGAAERGGTWRLDAAPLPSGHAAPLSAEAMRTYAGVLAAVSWTGTTSADWSDHTNWAGGLVPVDGDDVTIGILTNPPVLSTNSANLNSLTIAAATSLTVGAHTLNVTGTGINLSNSGATITVATGGTVSDAGGFVLATGALLTGAGSVTASGGYTGTGRITASGGTLDVNGTVNSGVVLTIASVSASTLKIEGTATSAAAIAMTSANQTLAIGASGTLTIGAAETISGGTISLAGGTLTDTSDLTIGTGAHVTGYGTVAANIAAGAGTITATTGGTLHLTGTVASGPTLAIIGILTNPAVLSIENTATAAVGIVMNNVGQTLAVSGSLTINAAETISAGILSLAGGTLTDTLGLAMAGPGLLTGHGTVAADVVGAGTLIPTGTITASDGTLHLAGTVASGPKLTIDSAFASELSIENTATAATAIAISNTNQTLAISGHLTINVAESITRGTIALAGGTLTDASVLTLGTTTYLGAMLTGYGTVDASIASSAGTITASGGTLHLMGTVGSTPMAIASGTTSVLSIENTATSAAAIAMTSANQTLAIGASGTLTIGAAESISNGTIALAGGTLADASNLTIGTSATLIGFGTVAANIAAGAGTITASNGTLHLTGTVASGPTLTIASGSASVLSVENTATAASAIGISNANQTLAIGASGNLTIGAAESVAAGKITLAGSLTDTSGLTLAGGTISGAGSVSASTAITGSGAVGISVVGRTVTASGGTLDLTGAMNASSILAIADVAGSVLKIDNSGVSIRPVTVDTSNMTLEIAQNATIVGASVIGAPHVVGSGTLTVDSGATLTDTSGITLDDAVLNGAGTIAAAITGYGTVSVAIASGGTVTANGGALVFTQAISDSSGVGFKVANSAASILQFNGTVGGNNAVQFVGALGALELNYVSISPNTLGYAGTVSGLDIVAGGTLDAGTYNYINVQTSITKVTIVDATHVDLWNGGTDLGTITFASNIAGLHVDFTADAGVVNHVIGSGTDVFLADAACFAPGTHILTPNGERDVETLAVGDLVLTTEGVAQPVAWIGRQTVSRVFGDLMRVLPIRIEAGALGENLPVRDLLVTPDHALLLGGVLIQAGALVNGTTIRRDDAVPEICTYYHVELEDHALILAEGVAAETFVDNVGRMAFDNWEEHLARWPNGREIGEMALPRAKSARQVPSAVREQLARRAGAKMHPAA